METTTTAASSRDAWLAARDEGLGASDTGALFGFWGSPFQLYNRVLKLIPPQEENDYMRWGNRLEPLVRDHYARETGRQVHGAPFIADLLADPKKFDTLAARAGTALDAGRLAATCDLLATLAENCEIAYGPDDDGHVILRSKARPWQMFTPDGFVYDVKKGWGTLQVKCTAMKDRWSDGLPEYHVPQALHEQSVSGLGYTSFAVLFNGNAFDWIDHDGDDEARAEVCEVGRAFWEAHVLAQEPPEADGSKSTAEALKKLYPNDNGLTVALPDDAIGWDEIYVMAKAAKKAAELEMKAAETRIKAAIGENTWGELANGQRFSLKTTVSSVVKLTLRDNEAEAIVDALELLAKGRADAVFLKTKIEEKMGQGPSSWRTLRRLKAGTK